LDISHPVPGAALELNVVESERMGLSGCSNARPASRLRLLFIHHSCGGQWLARVGPDVGDRCIYETAVNGGGLRDALVSAGYEVHEASYGSLIGDKTDVFDWPPKFREQMDEVLRCDRQDTFYPDARRNQIVMFKSCFPNNRFVGRGHPPGDPAGPELTVENAKAAYRLLLAEFRRNPQTLFVAVTAPPLARKSARWHKEAAKRLLGRPTLKKSGAHAREFNRWLTDSQSGWLAGYPESNVAVFDLYDVLTDHGASDFLRYPTGRGGRDSHPSSEGNQEATRAFLPLLERAVGRMALRPPDGRSD